MSLYRLLFCSLLLLFVPVLVLVLVLNFFLNGGEMHCERKPLAVAFDLLSSYRRGRAHGFDQSV